MDGKRPTAMAATPGAPLLTLEGHTAPVWSAAYSPAGDRIVTASDDETARVWDTATGAHLLTLAGHTDFVRSAAYSPAGDRSVTASWDGTVRVWGAATGVDYWQRRLHGEHSLAMRRVVREIMLIRQRLDAAPPTPAAVAVLATRDAAATHATQALVPVHLPEEIWLKMCGFLRSADFPPC